MVQKVIKIGNAIGMVLPKEAARKTGIRAGDSVVLREAVDGRVVFEKTNNAKDEKDGLATAEWATDFVQNNIDAFKELADK
jgi:antitoxin component of MazEF toxin-antitoxin module